MGWTLAVAFAAVAVGLIWRLRSSYPTDPPAPVPLSDEYRIHGRVELTSTCTESEAPLPEALEITTTLVGVKAQRQEASTRVELREVDSDSDDERRLEGTYALTVAWEHSRPPRSWEPPRASRTDGRNPCEGLGCDGRNRCVNIASRPRRIDLTGVETAFTLRVACICVPD